MPRKRKKDKDLPPRVYRSHGAFYFVDRQNKWHRLGKTMREMYAKLADYSVDAAADNTMNAVFKRYANEVLPTKADKTQTEQRRQLKLLISAFGKMTPDAVRPRDVAQYMDARDKKTAANREKSLLSHVFTKAIRWGYLDTNPCAVVERHPESPRTRYVEDHEYQAVYDMASPSIRIAMELARRTGLRLADILKLRRSDIKDGVLHVTTNKTGKEMRFRLDIQREKVTSLFLVPTRTGSKYSEDGFKSVWQSLMRRAMKQGLARFQFRDIRAKAGTDKELSGGSASKLLGNSPATAARHYKRRPEVQDPNDLGSFIRDLYT